jgi:uncharacterized protein YdeI (BOF family)
MKLEYTPNGVWFKKDSGEVVTFISKSTWKLLDVRCRQLIKIADKQERGLDWT